MRPFTDFHRLRISLSVLITLLTVRQTEALCSSKCSGVTSKFKYQVGSSYLYKYESQSKLQIVGLSQKAAPVNFEGTVTISVVAPCEFLIQVTNAKLTGPSTTQIGFDFAKEVEKYPLLFGYDNGLVQGICPDDQDTVDAVNIKRAIISALQIGNDFGDEEGYEKDISGRCLTKSIVDSSGNSKTITKTKNLLNCRQRQSVHSSFRIVPYFAVSQVQNSPALDAKQECKYKIETELIKEVTCSESHLILPFSRKQTNSGIKAIVSSKLTLSGQGKASTAPAAHGKLQDLLFNDNRIPYKESTDALAKAKEKLKVLTDSSAKEVRPESPGHFVELVYHVKKLSIDDLRTLIKEQATAGGKDSVQTQIIVDAVAQCGSQACVTLLTELLVPAKNPGLPSLNDLQRRLVLINLAFTPHPTKAGVVALTNLLSDLPAGGLYAATAFVNNYCRLHRECENNVEGQAFAKKYAGLISNLKLSATGKENLKHIETIRAFGNLGYLSDGIKERLALLDQDAHIDAKLAAVQSLRRAPCTPDLEKALTAKFADIKLPVELRLNIFLVIVRQCVKKSTICNLANITSANELNQIGSFVQSYFEQMRNSRDPSRNKNAFSMGHLSRKFPSDSRRHSRFYESSRFDYKTNYGYHTDTSVIFSPDSAFPKQAAFNLTIDANGQELNVIEIGVRTDHLEEAVDQILGPEGYVTNPGGFSQKEDRKIDIKDIKLKEFQTLFDKQRQKSTGLDVFGYVRLLGDEVGFVGDYAIPVIDRLQRLVKPAAVTNFFAEEKNLKFLAHRIPYDHHVAFPIISGLPLRLDVNGTLAINIEASILGNLKDVPNGNYETKLILKPSAAFETAYQFALHVGNVKNGVRWARVAHTATNVGVNTKLKDGDKFSAKIDLPSDKQELGSIESRIYTVINDVQVEEKGDESNQGKGVDCTPEKWAECTGLKLCTGYLLSNSSKIPSAPYFPLTGPFDVKFYVEKSDQQLKSYNFDASWKADKAGRDITFKFDTPGSKVNRLVTMTAKYVRQKSLDFEYKSPKNLITAKGDFEGAGPTQSTATMVVGVNGKNYEFKGKIDRSDLPANGRKYAFDGDVIGTDKSKVGKLKGSMELVPGKRAAVEAELQDLFDKPVTYKGVFDKTPGKYEIEHNFHGPNRTSNIKGQMNVKGFAEMDYSLTGELQDLRKDPAPHKFSYFHKHALNNGGPVAKLTSESKLTCSMYEAANTGYNLVADKGPEKLTVKLSTIQSGKPALSYDQLSNIKPGDFNTVATLKHPGANVDEKVTIVYKKMLGKDFEASAKYDSLASKKAYETSIVAKRQSPESYVGDYKAFIKTPTNEYSANTNVKPGAQPGQYQASSIVQYAPDKKAEISSVYSGNRKDLQLQSNIKLPGIEPLELTESHKFEPSGSGKFTGVIKKAGKVLYDVNFDLAKSAGDKQDVKARLKYPDQQFDVGLDGSFEKLPKGQQFTGTISRDGKEYSKAHIKIPQSWRYEDDKQIALGTTWALGSSDPKSINFKLDHNKAGNAINHDGHVEFSFPPNVNYKFQLNRQDKESKITNFTIFKKDKPILKLNGERLHKSVGSDSKIGNVDLSVQTFEPMVPRDLTGALSYDFAPKKYKTVVNLADRAGKRQIGADFGANMIQEADKTGYDKSLTLSVDNFETRLKNLYTTNKDGSQRVLKGEMALNDKLKKDEKKYGWNINGHPLKFTAVIDTPSKDAPKVTMNFDGSYEQKKRNHKYDVSWGPNKLGGAYTAEFADKFSQVNASFDSNSNLLKSIKYGLKQDSRKGADLNFDLIVNNQHKLGSLYRQISENGGDEKWALGFNSKLGFAVDFDSQASADWNVAKGKYVTKNSIRTSQKPTDKYKADLDFDANTMEVKLDMENIPGIKPPVKGKAIKVADQEYEITLEDATGPNKGKFGFKLTNPEQKLRVETSEFKSAYASSFTDKEWKVEGDINVDLKAEKNYGMKLNVATPDDNNRNVEVQVGYPGRKLRFASKRIRQLGVKVDETIELNSNVGKRESTKFQYLINRSPNVNVEFHLTDPKLPSGLHLASKYVKTGNYTDQNVDYSCSADFSLKYSADASKELKIMHERKRQIINKRPKISSSYAFNHDAANLKHKIWSSYLLEPCDSEVENCEYAFNAGAEFPDATKQVQRYDVDFKRVKDEVQAAATFAKDKYQITKKKGQFARSYIVSKNDKELLEVTGEMPDDATPTASLNIIKKPEGNVLFRISSSLQAEDFASVKLYHEDKGQLVKDVDASIALKTSKLLSVKFYKRPGLTESLKDLADRHIPKNLPTTITQLPAFAAPSSIGADMAKELKAMLDDWDKEQDDIAKELQVTSGKLGTAIGQQFGAASKAGQSASTTITKFANKFATVFSKIAGGYINSANDVGKQIPELIAKLGPQLKAAGDDLKGRLNQFFTSTSKAADQTFKGSGFDDFLRKVIDAIRKTPDGPLPQRILALLQNLQQAFGGDSKGGAVANLFEKINSISQERWKQLANLFDQVRKDMSQKEDYKEMAKFLDVVYGKLAWALQANQERAGETAQSFIESVTEESRLPLFNKSADGTTYMFNIPLLHHFNSLQDLSCALSADRVRSNFLEAKDKLDSFVDSIVGSLDRSSGLFGFGDSRAVIAGDNHFITFDGELRSFSADCSYLLARDYIDSRFSVAANFEKGVRKSITVQYDDYKIDLSNDGKITINGKPAQLPFNVEDKSIRNKLRVYNSDEYVTIVESFDGLKLECNSFINVCYLSLAARFRGKTNGLLGQNNGETYTDMLLPDGSVTTSMDAYLSAWALNSACAKNPSQSLVEKLKPDEKLASNVECLRLFGSNQRRSPFSRCSGLKSDQFLNACLHDAKKLKSTADEIKQKSSVCASAAAFVAACSMESELPSQCMQCKVGNQALELGKTMSVTDKSLLKDVDVLLVVEDRHCLSSFKNQLPALATKVEANLKQGGYNPLFGVVGFNGKGLHESVSYHSLDSKVLYPASQVKSVIDQFPFDLSSKVFLNPLDVLGQIVDHFSFRPASRKLILLAICSNCETLELDYYNVREKLLQQSFSVHIVTTQRIELSGGSKDSFIGFDAKAFLKADLSAKTDARPLLVEPHDPCTVLSQETNGTVFSISDKNNINSVVSAAASTLGQTASGNDCTSCDCISYKNYPKAFCSRCTPPQPADITADKSGFFNNPFQKLTKVAGG